MTATRLFLAAALASLVACGDGAPRTVVATGTLQVDEVDLGPIVPSRVVRVFVEEGDSVSPGDTLVTLTQATLAPDLAVREARLQAAQAHLDELERGSRPEEIARARAQLAAAAAEADRTADDLRRASGHPPCLAIFEQAGSRILYLARRSRRYHRLASVAQKCPSASRRGSASRRCDNHCIG